MEEEDRLCADGSVDGDRATLSAKQSTMRIVAGERSRFRERACEGIGCYADGTSIKADAKTGASIGVREHEEAIGSVPRGLTKGSAVCR